MKSLRKSNWIKVSLLTAATSVAAVFISLLVFKIDFLYLLLSKKINQLELSGQTLKLSRISKNEIGLDFFSETSNQIVSSRWRPDFSFFPMQADLTGHLNIESHEVTVKIRVPLSISRNPLDEIQLELFGAIRDLNYRAEGVMHQVSDRWEGNAQTQWIHPSWGTFEPHVHFIWNKSAQVLVTLKPEGIQRSFIQADKEIRLKFSVDQGFILGDLAADQLSFLFSDKKASIQGFSIQFDDRSERGTFQLKGEIASISAEPFISDSLKDIFLKASWNGKTGLNHKKQPFFALQGQIKDSLNSIAIPFKVNGTPNHSRLQAKLNIDLFEGSAVDLAMRNFLPNTKLLSGKLRGQLSNEVLQMDLEPATLLFGNTLIRSLQGSVQGNIPRRELSFKKTTLEITDGNASISPFIFSMKNPETPVSFRADDLELDKILSSYPKSRLSGSGRFRGTGAFILRPPQIFLSNLKLENSTPGTISYPDPNQPYFEKKIIYLNEFQDLLAQGQQALVFKALENFHYTHIRLEANRESSEQMKVLLNLKGKNPDLAKGQPFDITFPIEGEIASLIQGSLLQQPVADELNKRHLRTE